MTGRHQRREGVFIILVFFLFLKNNFHLSVCQKRSTLLEKTQCKSMQKKYKKLFGINKDGPGAPCYRYKDRREGAKLENTIICSSAITQSSLYCGLFCSAWVHNIFCSVKNSNHSLPMMIKQNQSTFLYKIDIERITIILTLNIAKGLKTKL